MPAKVLLHRCLDTGATAELVAPANTFSLSWETLSIRKGLQNSDLWHVSADIRGKGVILRGQWNARPKCRGSLSWSGKTSLPCLVSPGNATVIRGVGACQRPAKMFSPQNRQAQLSLCEGSREPVWNTDLAMLNRFLSKNRLRFSAYKFLIIPV